LRKIREANASLQGARRNQFFSTPGQHGPGLVCRKQGFVMGKVMPLIPQEVVLQDVEAIAVIYRNLGAPTAEQMVTRALGELALLLAALADRVRGQDMRDLAPHLARLGRLAGDLGLTSLALVARDAQACLQRPDDTAFAAVWARLLRVAERTLSPGPDRVDQSG
jgi:hypothetical protein